MRNHNTVEPKRKRKIEIEPGKSASYVETEAENREPKNLTSAPLVESEPTLTNNYLDIESIPVVMFGDDIVIDHTETVENDNKNCFYNTISNNEIKESAKVKILSDISITDSKLVNDAISVGALKLIPPSTKLPILSKAATFEFLRAFIHVK
ncbi:unnamed protein product [Parnassius apollo]|uniref:(apollo) hypothetical protein n=1 Tax=Parnassius apollo TaxID=110799 RepID=A0A8S3Y859_PARAO|nr:unnamed protein product [Parnassius apollo]